ncbi:phage portal protein [Comamonas sp. J-3]|uniref:phage portal protein n=1 Tax=Comamonas trifloxystrobinivorans TaxID=3350256 RepID=UPI003726BF81
MAKRNRNRAHARGIQHSRVPDGTHQAVDNVPHGEGNSQLFSFQLGEPEPVIGGRAAIMEYAECVENGPYYEPPVSLAALARLLRVGAHHESALRCKVNILASTFVPTPWLSAAAFKAFVFDFCVLGNAYLEWRENLLGDKLVLRHTLAKYMRVGIEPWRHFLVTDMQAPHEFKRGSILHLREPDLHQEIYGVPGYLGAMQSAQLNESATLFRRRYYNNGSHAGFILYATDPAQRQEDIDALRQQLTQTKNGGNFRNVFYYAPNGKKDGLQLIPISEVAAKDDFLSIKNASRDDVLAAHRVPPQVIGMLPNAAGGFGDVEKAAKVFARNEIVTLQTDIAGAINEQAGREVVRFIPYKLDESDANE